YVRHRHGGRDRAIRLARRPVRPVLGRSYCVPRRLLRMSRRSLHNLQPSLRSLLSDGVPAHQQTELPRRTAFQCLQHQPPNQDTRAGARAAPLKTDSFLAKVTLVRFFHCDSPILSRALKKNIRIEALMFLEFVAQIIAALIERDLRKKMVEK